MPWCSQARYGSADWLFQVVGVDLSNHSLLLLVRMMMGGDNNGDSDDDSTCVGSHAGAIHWRAGCKSMLTAAVRPRMQLQSVAAARNYAASINASSSDRTTNLIVQTLQMVARAAHFRAQHWSDTDASERSFLCPDLDLFTIVYDQPAFEQAPSRRYRQLPPQRRKA